MAITAFSYGILRAAFQHGLLPKAETILEFGEANWYGDVPPQTLSQDIKALVKSEEEQIKLEAHLAEVLQGDANATSFGLAKIFYGIFFGKDQTLAIDFHGTEGSLKIDLNTPFTLDQQFDVTINNGTAEHIFNFGQFFTSMHQVTKPGGTMIHEGPMIKGWIDHGFVNFQPTLFFDMAVANGYEILLFSLGGLSPLTAHVFDSREKLLKFAETEELPPNTVFLVILRKGPTETDFVFPIQGFYDNSISEEARNAWKNLR